MHRRHQYHQPALVGAILLALLPCQWVIGEEWPALPERNAAVMIPAQEWPRRPGPRTVRVLVHYPEGELQHVSAHTGLMLTLHNWGGTDCVGTADPRALADRLDVVAICVNYLQSGKQDSIDGPEPYDFGYLQALDALRALYFVQHGLKSQQRPFAKGRIYATGGSGGGNVSLMANKLAPRTFAALVDMCGMPKLSDDIAFNLPGGSGLDARYSRDPGSPNFLSRDEQELRFVGNPEHLAVMRQLGSSCKIVVVHGTEDATCPYADAREMTAAMQRARLDVEPHFIGPGDLDGRVFTSAGHPLGNRTEIVFQTAGKYLLPGSPDAVLRKGPTDFDRRGEVRYPTSNGTFVISYAAGFPVSRFEPEKPPVSYREHQDLQYYLDEAGERHPVKTAADWEVRRRHILANLQLVTGKLPGPTQRVPLDVKVEEEVRVGRLTRRKLTFQSDANDRVPAYLFLPAANAGEKHPAVLCLQQTTVAGKAEPAGLDGDPSLHYALHLAERGYVTLAPDYPSLGEHAYDFDPQRGYQSGTMKAIWDNVRALDLLESLAEVDPQRIGCLGHSLGGHNGMFTAAFDPRIRVLVSSCGFSRFHKDDVPSWTGPRYMPRIASVYHNDADRLPFDFTELVAAFAPRAFLACAAEQDGDFDVSGVRDAIAAARPIYELLGKPAHLDAYYPQTGHAFPPDARDRAYQFLDRHLKGEPTP
jgi:cephalosporin-C deacetylase-like acetyl esterase